MGDLARWAKMVLSPCRKPRLAPDTTFDNAIRLTDEVAAEVRERAHTTDPFRAVLADLILRKTPPDPAVIADAYEATQEANIYKGLMP